MSNWSAAFDLGELDLDSAFQDTVFAHFHEAFGRMNSSASTAPPVQHAFEERVAAIKASKSDLNALILDYLTTEGYAKAAAKFCKEANLQPLQPNSSVQDRQKIQHAINSGDIERAITDLNELYPELLDEDPQLHFSLLRLQLVELIRKCNNGDDVMVAVDFASKKLAPRAATDRAFLLDLEQTMSLIIFPHDNLKPELAALLSSDLRRSTAAKVNKAVLRQQNERREAAIRQLVRMRAWSETSARSKEKELPETMDLGLYAGNDNTTYSENGHEAMIMT